VNCLGIAGTGGTSEAEVGREPVKVRAGAPRLEAASYRPGGSVCGSPLIAPVLYEAMRCMAMMNSVTSSWPRCCVSDKFHIRPKVSFGNLALSNIVLAVSPTAAVQFTAFTQYGQGPDLIVRHSGRQTCQTDQSTH
jgi:hypothetical protein